MRIKPSYLAPRLLQFIEMKPWTLILSILLMNSACSVYRSDGRKEFESLDFSKASFYLMNCQKIESYSALQNTLLNSGYDEMTLSPYFIWSRKEVSYLHVVSLSEDTKSCHWAFENQESFLKNSSDFIDMLETTTSEESTAP